MRERVEFGGRNKREIRKRGKEKNAEETRVRKKARERERKRKNEKGERGETK